MNPGKSLCGGDLYFFTSTPPSHLELTFMIALRRLSSLKHPTDILAIKYVSQNITFWWRCEDDRFKGRIFSPRGKFGCFPWAIIGVNWTHLGAGGLAFFQMIIFRYSLRNSNARSPRPTPLLFSNIGVLIIDWINSSRVECSSAEIQECRKKVHIKNRKRWPESTIVRPSGSRRKYIRS